MKKYLDKIKNFAFKIVAKFKSSISIVLTTALIILVIFEIFVLKRAISTNLTIAKANPPVQASQLVRINFTDYDKIIKRMSDASGFVAPTIIYDDPFGIKVEPKNTK